MITKNASAIILCILFIFNISACKSPKPSDNEFTPTKQHKAEDAIRVWMLDNKDYGHYKPIVFGDINSRYERSDRTVQLLSLIDQEEQISVETGNYAKVDSLKVLLENNKGLLLGYIMLHKFESTNLAGETTTKECLFFLDTTLRVASVLSPESFDMIMTEKLFYRLDPEN